MAKTKQYQHFCPVARTLEVIGEKWSLLIVRDLLRGKQRFTDLLRFASDITPKWLTLRLRDLESAGIVERDSQEGRREVWYRLTDEGRDLAPVLAALLVWGLKHNSRPPLIGETIHPEHILMGLTFYLNHTFMPWPPEAVTWVFHFEGDGAHMLRFDGRCWSVGPGDDQKADVDIQTTPEVVFNLLTAQPADRQDIFESLNIQGDNVRVEEFLATFEVDVGLPLD